MSTSRGIRVLVNAQVARSGHLPRQPISNNNRTNNSLLLSKRGFSNNQDPVVMKLKYALEEYRNENYAYELISRFRKEVLRVLDNDEDGVVSSEDIHRLLHNIGKSSYISQKELVHVMGEDSKVSVQVIGMLI